MNLNNEKIKIHTPGGVVLKFYKLTALVLSLLILIMTASCGDNTNSTDESQDGNTDTTVTETTGLSVGDIVSYNPPASTYTWRAEYGIGDESIEDDREIDNTDDWFKITQWRVLSVEGNQVSLVPTEISSGTVRLVGARGYNNGVYLLNEACSQLYGDPTRGITARNIAIEDIEPRMTEEVKDYGKDETTSTKDVKYGEQAPEAFTVNTDYPIMYALEKNSVIDGETASKGLGPSEQTNLIEADDNGAVDGSLKAKSLQPIQTAWNDCGAGAQEAESFIEYENGKSYKEILMPNNMEDGSGQYWIASRNVGNSVSGSYDSNAYFGLFVMNDYERGNGLGTSTLALSNNKGGVSNYSLFPVVTADVDSVKGDSKSGYTL